MKRAGNLIEKIACPDNIRRALFKTLKGKRDKKDAQDFVYNLNENIRTIRNELLSGSVSWGRYHTFTIYDPKERQICAAPFRDRVIHHAIINICEPVFESFQIYDSYACRKGKGLDAALERAVKFTRQNEWFLKMDVRKYFDSIDHDTLKWMLRRKFKDPRLIQIFDQIIESYHTRRGSGIPIGNLTSQFFANHYLALMDHFIKERLRCRDYLRYMDDFVVWHDSKEHLKGLRNTIQSFFHDKLHLLLKPECINKTNRGLTYLGYRLSPSRIELSRRSKKRFRRTLMLYNKKYEVRQSSETDTARHVEPLIAFVKRAESEAFRRSVLNDMGL